MVILSGSHKTIEFVVKLEPQQVPQSQAISSFKFTFIGFNPDSGIGNENISSVYVWVLVEIDSFVTVMSAVTSA